MGLPLAVDCGDGDTNASYRELRYSITILAALRDLGHRIPLELIAEIYLDHLRLLTSNLGKKASRNLGAIHISNIQVSLSLKIPSS